MKLAGVLLDGRAVMAPLAGVSDRSYRRICREAGAALVCTEMVSADGLVRDDRKTKDYAAFLDAERPVAVQLFGADPAVMADAAARVEAEFSPDFIDLNFGCPVPKVVKRNAGAAVMKDPDRAEAIVRAVCSAVKTPVLVKIRTGWDPESIISDDMGRRAEDAGAAAVTLHARTQSQFFRGRADWTYIASLKQAVEIPVIGNGDVFTGQDAARMRDETGCDLVMVGRGCQGNPWIFTQVHAALAGTDVPAPPDAAERIRMCRHHLRLLVHDKGENRGVRESRKHIAWYTKGMPGSARLRNEAFQQPDLAGTEAVLDKFLEAVRTKGHQP